jgi:Transglycosylase SLT domain
MSKSKDFKSSNPGIDGSVSSDNSFDFENPKDDRNAATKLKDGILEGGFNALKNESFIRDTLKNTLPVGYGSAMDLQQEVTSGVKQLYNNAVKEIKPSVGELAKTAEKLMPAKATYLRKSLKDIENWSKNDLYSRSNSFNEEDREKDISNIISETFKFQMEKAAESQAINDSKERLHEGLEVIRHRDTFGMLNSINLGMSRLVQYQDKVTASFHRKLLEVQYRSYFVLKDSLDENRKQNASTMTALANIVKNTGLPDYVKMSEMERIGSFTRNKFASLIDSKLFAGRGSAAIPKIVDHASNVVKEHVEKLKESFLKAADVASQIHDTEETIEGGGLSKTEFGASMLGGEAAEWLGSKLGKKAKKRLEKHPELVKLGLKINSVKNQLPQHIQAFSKSENPYNNPNAYEIDPLKNLIRKVKGFAYGAGQRLAGVDYTADSSITNDSLEDNTKSFNYTKQTHKSINEVIPGYLARIFREIQVLRTGDTSIGMTTYDLTKSRFVDSKQLTKSIKDHAINERNSDGVKSDINAFLREYDPHNKLDANPQAKAALIKKLLKDNINSELGTAKRMTDSKTYYADDLTKGHADILTEHAKSYFGSDLNSLSAIKKDNNFGALYSALGVRASGSGKEVQDMVNLGLAEPLVELGFLTKTKNGSGESLKINYEKLMNYHAGLDVNETQLSDSNVRPNSKGVTFIQSPHLNSTNQLNESVKQTNQYAYNNGISGETNASISLLDTISKLISRGNDDRNYNFIRNDTTLHGILEKISTSGNDDTETRSLVKPNWNLIKRGSKFIGRGIGAGLNAGTKLMKSGLSTAGTIISGGWGATKGLVSVLGKGLDWVGTSSDLYVGSEETPRLTSAKLKAGLYTDKVTGNILKSLKGIKGAVLEDGNVVLAEDEIPKSFIRDTKGSGIIKLASMIGNFSLKASSGLIGLIPPVYKFIFDAGKKLFDTGIKLLDQPCDVYVKGIELPVLTKLIMKNGGYRVLATGKIVTRPGDITGPVVNEANEVVLTEDQIKSGLFDIRGQSIASPLSRLLGMGKNLLNTGAAVVKGAFNLGKSILKSGLRGAGKILGSVGNLAMNGLSGIGGFSNNDATLSKLDDIYKVLDSRLPGKKVFGDEDGDGVREGSWKTMGKKKPKPGKETENKASLFDKAKGGIAAAGGGIIDTIKNAGGLLGDLYAGGKMAGTALGWGGKALLAAGGLGVSGLAAAAGTVASGIGAVLTSPVILPAIAIGAAAYGGYKLYKHFTKSTSKLITYRLVQYGFQEINPDDCSKALELESMLSDLVVFDTNKTAKLIDGKLDLNKALGIFNVSREDPKAFNNWISWFTNRFKPIYLLHLTALASINPKLKLENIDDLSPKEKQAFLGIVKWPDGPYNYGVNPDLSSPVRLSDSKDVEATYRVAKDEIDNLIKNDKNPLNTPKDKSAIYGADAVGGAGVVRGSITGPLNKDAINSNKAIKAGQTANTLAMTGMNNAILDGEGNNSTAFGGSPDNFSYSGTSDLKLAGGPMSDGRNASQYMRLASGVSINRINPTMRKNLDALIDEYGKLTGKTFTLTDGFRTYAQQAALHAKDSNNAAPGSSMHEFGLAIDGDRVALNEMDKLGLLRKYGFTRPVGGEPWHLEPIGVQSDLTGFKLDPNKASDAITSGLGRGGGGYGTMAKASYAKRDGNVSKSIFDATVMASAISKPPTVPDASPITGTVPKPIQTTLGKASTTPIVGVLDSEQGVNVSGKVTLQTDKTVSNSNTLKETIPGTSGPISSIPAPNGQPGWNNNKDVILGAAKLTGVDPSLMASVVSIESDFNPKAKNTLTSAAGYNQFVDGTWRESLRLHGKKYGLSPNTSPFDARANAVMGAEYLKSNARTLSGVKQNITGTDLYLAHLLGPSGAKKFLGSDPSSLAASLMPDAASSNPGLFYDRGKPRSVGDMYSLLNTKMQTSLQKNGVDPKYFGTDLGFKPNSLTGTGLSVNGTKGFAGSVNKPVVTAQLSNEQTNVSQSYAPTPQVPPPSPFVQVSSFGDGVNRQANYNQPQQNPRADMVAVVTDVTGILTKSLNVQTQMLSALQVMANTVNKVKDEKSNMSTLVADNNSVTVPNRYEGTPVPNVPVRMNRV